MGLPAGYELRAPGPEDVEAVAEILAADGMALDAHFLRDEWSRSGFELATDAWVVDRAGAIVGYGQVLREEPTVLEAWGVVHPEHRKRGLGSALMDRIEERASQLQAGTPSPRFRHAIKADDLAAAAMLLARSMRPIRHFWHMQIDLVTPLQEGAPPDGIEIRPIEPDEDLPAVHRVLDEAFAEDWGHHSEPFERWAEEQAGSPSFDPTLWLLAAERGEPVGALTANVWGDRGWVAELGVLKPYRGRGVGVALLRRSFGTFADRGLEQVLLNVDAENPTGATALYERAGMRVVNQWDLWECPWDRSD